MRLLLLVNDDVIGKAVADDPALVRSFFGHPSVAYVSEYHAAR